MLLEKISTDINCQNEWIWENIFDAAGNDLYCVVCVRALLGVSKQRLRSLPMGCEAEKKFKAYCKNDKSRGWKGWS